MTRAEAAKLGGRARAAALTPERRSEIARLGFDALVSKRFGGVRRKAVAHLQQNRGLPAGVPSATPEEGRQRLHDLWHKLNGPADPSF
jgi:general stress protein YciG